MAHTGQPKANRGPVKATREDWVHAALRVLLTEGVDQVLVLPLADKLKVSRSSFYWYFKNRQELLEQLLAHWSDTNTRSIIEQAGRASDTIVDGVLQIFECWVDECIYSPRLDFAIRSWARQSARVRKLVEQADDTRIEAIRGTFRRHGYSEEDALIRARVLYFMQVGYYALDVKEPMEARLSHLEAYLRAFTGQDPTAAQIRRFQEFTASQARRPGPKRTGPSRPPMATQPPPESVGRDVRCTDGS